MYNIGEKATLNKQTATIIIPYTSSSEKKWGVCVWAMKSITIHSQMVSDNFSVSSIKSPCSICKRSCDCIWLCQLDWSHLLVDSLNQIHCLIHDTHSTGDEIFAMHAAAHVCVAGGCAHKNLITTAADLVAHTLIHIHSLTLLSHLMETQNKKKSFLFLIHTQKLIHKNERKKI